MKFDIEKLADGQTDFREKIDLRSESYEKPGKELRHPKRFPKRGFRLSKVALMWLLMEISFSNASGVYLSRKFGISEGMVSRYKKQVAKELDRRKQQYLVLYRADGSLFF